MCKKLVVLVLGAALCLTAMPQVSLAQVENLAQNPSFEETDGVLPNVWGTPGWTTWNSAEGNGGVVDFDDVDFIDGSRSLKVEPKGTAGWHFQVIQVQLRLEVGTEYTASIWAKAEEPRAFTMQFKSLDNSNTWGNTPLELTTEWAEYSMTAEALGNNTVKLELHCAASDVPLWLDFCNVYEGPYVEGILPDGLSAQVLARDPNPAQESDDVPFDINLGWTPGEFSQTHDVYFDTVWDDVNAASTDNPLGVTVRAGQAEATFDPGQLAFDQTYHWRVDEVNGAPDFDVHKGNIWSFTVEPKALPITAITVTASGANPMMAPENTINGSGLDSMDQHSIMSTDMWLTVTDGSWIQYEFDRPYKLYELLVWNSNQAIEAFIGFGVKEMTVEYSVDGETWSALDGIVTVSKASGQPTNAVNAVIDMGGIMARQVKLSVVSAHGFTGQAGLSEVRFMSIPVLPRTPQPTDGDTTASVDVQLSWRSGREAASHDVALSADRTAVINGTAPVTSVSDASLDTGALDFGTAYTWQVVEVNDAASPTAHTGGIWSFTTPQYSRVDDFESYSGDEGEEVFMTWWDGFGGDDSLGGSTTGHIDSPFVETSIVNAGTGSRQSLPMFFDNNGGFVNIDAATSAPRTSEVLREFDGLDLTEGNAQVLALSFRGNPAGFSEDAGNITMSATGADIWGAADEFRYAYKRLSGDGSMVAQVQSLGTADPWSKAGVMIRDTLAADSAFAMMVATGTNGVTFQYRSLGAGNAAADNGDRDAAVDPAMNQDDEPVWVRIDRSGDNFNAYWSLDGANWSPSVHNPQTIQMGASIYIGLAVTSHSPGNPTTAEFSDVSTTGNVTGAYTAAVIGDEAMPSNEGTDPLYLIVEDNAGKTVTVTHPDATAIQSAAWQSWLIPMTEFSSLRENNIKAITLGVGYKNGSQAGSEGVLYIDDLRLGTPIQ